jgi:hypothetical protein
MNSREETAECDTKSPGGQDKRGTREQQGKEERCTGADMRTIASGSGRQRDRDQNGEKE